MLLISSLAFSQTLHNEIQTVYNFSPGKLSQEEQNKRIPLMDAFWKKVKSDTTAWLNELRAELKKEGNPPFFYFEGGQLLLSLSENVNDKQIVLDAISRSDINDIDRRTYVTTLNHLAQEKLNTTTAALKILDDKDFKIFLPAHAFTFIQGYCFTYALLPTDPSFYLKPVMERFTIEKNIVAQKSIVTFLWFANTCTGNNFLKAVSIDASVNQDVREYVIDLLGRKLKKNKEFKSMDDMSVGELVEAQGIIISMMSDEAIYELDYVTKVLRSKGCR
jgi:hypothetical protein